MTSMRKTLSMFSMRQQNHEMDEKKHKRIITLSTELAGLIGKPVRPPSLAGLLEDRFGTQWHWYKCPHHDTWLQPEWEPFNHWRCAVHSCTHIKAAKMRTRTERHIFNSFRFMLENL